MTQDRIFSEPNHDGALQEDWESIFSRTAESLVLNLNAENAVAANGKQLVVESVSDLSGQGHHATQSQTDLLDAMLAFPTARCFEKSVEKQDRESIESVLVERQKH